MTLAAEQCDVAIAGGGAVGLLLGCLLAQAGVDVRVLERRATPSDHSRAVGIHPPGLACLAQAGVAEALIARGVQVRRAQALGEDRTLGSISFTDLPPPYAFVLCVPQQHTERALAARLQQVARAPLRRGHEVLSCRAHALGTELQVRGPAGSYTLTARFAVGCDGKYSRLRSAAAIPFRGRAERAHFAMVDTLDETPFGADAAVFLKRAGLVESFPLPDRQRRWVVQLTEPDEHVQADTVERLVWARTGLKARAAAASMVSTFTPERFLAERFCVAPLALAGDAAHVLSPIGGQGMNLGWLDAALLAPVLCAALAEPERASRLLSGYGRARRRAAQAAARRAALYLALGSAQRLSALRERVIEGLLSPALAPRMALLFTMHGLSSVTPAAAERTAVCS